VINMVTDPHAKRGQAIGLSNRDEVAEAYKTTGEYDILIIVFQNRIFISS